MELNEFMNGIRKNQYIGVKLYRKSIDGVWQFNTLREYFARHRKDCIYESLSDEMMRSIGNSELPAHQIVDVTDDLYMVVFRIQRGTKKESFLLEKGYIEIPQK